MSLSPPISVLTILAAAFVVMGIARGGGECVLTDKEEFSPVKAIRWAGDVIASMHRPTCDILSFDPSDVSERAIEIPVLRFRNDDNSIISMLYVFHLNSDGSGFVALQARGINSESRKAWVGPVRRILAVGADLGRSIKFQQMAILVAPLKTKATTWDSYPYLIKRDEAGNVIEEYRPEIKNRGKCDDRMSIPEPWTSVQFLESDGRTWTRLDRIHLCSFAARNEAAGRIDNALNRSMDALQFKPSEPIFVTL